jgi:hypothetical protein
MSTAEPIMPPHPQPQVQPSDIDDDRDVDILPYDPADTPDTDAEAPAELPENPAFQTPTPGATLSESELEADLDGAED